MLYKKQINFLVIWVLLVAVPRFSFADEFKFLSCEKPVTIKLLKKGVSLDKSSPQPVKQIIEKYSGLGLKDLGGDGADGDSYHAHAWEICGKKYVFLYDHKNSSSSRLSDLLEGEFCGGNSSNFLKENKEYEVDERRMKFKQTHKPVSCK